MKPTKFLPMMALMALLSFSCSTENFPDETIDAVTLANAPAAKAIEIEILELINNHRITLGLNPLNHDNFYQRKNSLMQNAAATKVSENVAYAFSSAESVVNAWINSDGHRATIEGDYTDFDISAEKNDEGKWFFTNIFIKR